MLVYYISLCFYKCRVIRHSVIGLCANVCITEKPGTCPKKIGVGPCVDMCFDDSDCPKNKKCCSNGCGHKCMVAYKGIYILC